MKCTLRNIPTNTHQKRFPTFSTKMTNSVLDGVGKLSPSHKGWRQITHDHLVSTAFKTSTNVWHFPSSRPCRWCPTLVAGSQVTSHLQWSWWPVWEGEAPVPWLTCHLETAFNPCNVSMTHSPKYLTFSVYVSKNLAGRSSVELIWGKNRSPIIIWVKCFCLGNKHFLCHFLSVFILTRIQNGPSDRGGW